MALVNLACQLITVDGVSEHGCRARGSPGTGVHGSTCLSTLLLVAGVHVEHACWHHLPAVEIGELGQLARKGVLTPVRRASCTLEAAALPLGQREDPHKLWHQPCQPVSVECHAGS